MKRKRENMMAENDKVYAPTAGWGFRAMAVARAWRTPGTHRVAHRADRRSAALAGGLWCAAAVIYLGSEVLAAAAFSPAYSYARNYISDLGVPVCGMVFDGRPICSPLHLVMNVGFALQGVCFFGAAVAMMRVLRTPSRFVLLVCAALDGLGLVLLGLFPENAPIASGAGYHVLGALLAIVFGNATGLASAFAFAGLDLARIHRVASLVLPLVAALAFALLLRARVSPMMVPDGIWERLSVYTITGWELLTAVCLIGWARRPVATR